MANDLKTGQGAPIDDEYKKALSRALIALYRGVVYKEQSDEIWRSIINMKGLICDHFSVLGIMVCIDEAEGFAYLRYPIGDDVSDEDSEIPRLIPRRKLTFHVSLMTALLRRRMAESEAQGEARLVMSSDEIVRMMRTFLPDNSNDARMTDKIESCMAKVEELGFLHRLKDSRNFEVQRIIKAYVNAQWLSEFDKKLEEYRDYINGGGTL